MANCPTGPAPKTAMVSPRLTSASRAPNQPVGKMSDTRMAWSLVTWSRTRTSVAAAYGIAPEWSPGHLGGRGVDS